MGTIFKYWFFLITATVITSGFVPVPRPNPSVAVNLDIGHSVERKFKRDAARLALRTMQNEYTPHSLPVEIPISLVEDFYQILIGLYNAEPTARLLEKCNVHTFPDPPIDHFVLVYNHNAEWAKPLTSGARTIQYPPFEKLIRSHSLIIEKQYKWDSSHGAISVRAENPLNTVALVDKFLKIDGIVAADLSIPRTQGNDILAKRIKYGWEITYLMKFGAHSPNGTKQHTWRYRYMDTGEIVFLGDTGDTLPEWMACAR